MCQVVNDMPIHNSGNATPRVKSQRFVRLCHCAHHSKTWSWQVPRSYRKSTKKHDVEVFRIKLDYIKKIRELVVLFLSSFLIWQSFSTSIYASSWFLTLFTTTLSLPLACRIMDVFLSEGIEIVFKVALAMLTLGKNDLLSLDMESILKVSQLWILHYYQFYTM